MSEVVDTYWSFRSPYSYLAIPDLLQLRRDYDVDIRLRVVLPLAVRAKETVFDPANLKPAHYILLDSTRRSEFLGIPFVFPPNPDPVVQDFETFKVAQEQPFIFRLCKLGVEAERRGKGLDFANAVSRLIMGGTVGWDQGDHLRQAVASTGLDLDDLEAATVSGEHLEEVERNHERLDAAGH
ncbi:2-hydroxychromene-2-carboxylate isomerase [Halioglobus japonicus]|nr:2-hydroxychromene-2-carboxylate isomerase [Halioglobus japonicus]